MHKISELIHSSSDFQGANQLQSAKVEVHFHEIIDTGSGDDDYTVVPGSEIVVAREVFRGDPEAEPKIPDKSNYYLDDKKATFADVATYLNSKGIDLDNNRFLILQGEVEMISMMPPKSKTTDGDDGLLEYLEDIIGSSKYVADADAKLAEVEALSEERQGKLSRVKAVEKEKDGLAHAKGEAMMFVRVERKVRSKKNVLYQMNMAEVRSEKEVTQAKLDAMKEKIDESKKEVEEAEARLKDIEESNQAEVEEKARLVAEEKKAKGAYADFERRDIKMREDVKHAKAEVKRLKDKVAKEGKKAKAAEKKSKDASESVPNLEAAVSKAAASKEKEDAKLEKILDDVRGDTGRIREELELKNRELGPVQEERSSWEAKLDTAVTEKSLIEDATSRTRSQLESAETELENLDEFKSGKEEEVKQAKADLKSSKEELASAKAEEADLAGKEDGLKKRYQKFTAKSEEAKASLAAGGSRSEAVSGILRASKKVGELYGAGIRGRLGDLARIPDKYDTAVSTACGMLDHVVCDTTAGAQAALKFLRKHGLGRANFIPLDKMRRGAHDRAVETPEGAPRLFDLIDCPDDLKAAVFLGVGQTIVASDLETATRYAYDFGRRWRVVTVGGQLIETSGTMAGGGGRVKKGGMKLASAKSGSSGMDVVDADVEDAEESERAATQALKEYKQCRERRRQLEVEIRDLEKRVKSLTVAIPKLEMEIVGVETTRTELTRSIPELQEASKMSPEDKAKLKSLTAAVDKIKADMKKCVELAEALEADVSDLQKQIVNAGGAKLKKQQAACDAAQAALKSANTDLNTARVTIESGKKASVKAIEDAAAAEKLAEDESGKLEEWMTTLKEIEEGAFEAMEVHKAAKEAADAKSEEMEKKDKELEVRRGADEEGIAMHCC